MQNLQFFLRKLLGFVIFLIYYQVVFFSLSPAIFEDIFISLGLFLFYLYLLIEQIYKIEPPEGYKVQRGDIYIILLFLLYPFIIVIAYSENVMLISQFLPLWNSDLIKILGILLLAGGTSLTFGSRLQLGKYGTSIIIVTEDHELITTGIYKYIRHPIYLGALLTYTSIQIIMGSILVSLTIFSFMFIVTKGRISEEERLLDEKFGDRYLEYVKRTKKMIPFIY